jgi:hypothetical protein
MNSDLAIGTLALVFVACATVFRPGWAAGEGVTVTAPQVLHSVPSEVIHKAGARRLLERPGRAAARVGRDA